MIHEHNCPRLSDGRRVLVKGCYGWLVLRVIVVLDGLFVDGCRRVERLVCVGGSGGFAGGDKRDHGGDDAKEEGEPRWNDLEFD